MMLPPLLLGFLVFSVVGLGLGLWRLGRIRRSGPPAVQAARLEQFSERRYRPMTRLFDTRDLRFLQGQKGYQARLAWRFRLQRRQVLALYLRQVRADFHQWHHYWCAISPRSEDTDFAKNMVRRVAVFYTLYAALQLQCLTGWLIYRQIDVASLLGVLHHLHRRTRRVLDGSVQPWQTASWTSRGQA